MHSLPYEASHRERQIAMAVLAHTARHDADAVTAMLHHLAESIAEDVHPICVITALLNEFQQGMDMYKSNELAEWFSDQALALAANDAAE
ncbi:hypothetical protein [Nocardia terpenica]|uniref:Uncharacterized protein n=1 Tax=Nocardia terpenica TaxID=455432 RepID=A0A164PEN8_9NOCA|nr:hypothetical protein [Nocardia terpenica]KZM75468.1 hypothetical protein AWN90_18990 [Nocardia terpenica]NQE85936.1 hypothetical protein [Nocardia terpenica]